MAQKYAKHSPLLPLLPLLPNLPLLLPYFLIFKQLPRKKGLTGLGLPIREKFSAHNDHFESDSAIDGKRSLGGF